MGEYDNPSTRQICASVSVSRSMAMDEQYDTIIIGAGIAGCCVAYALQSRGSRVLVVDRSSVAASGGSGAAGAFVSPKIGKGSPLQTLTNEAFEFAKEFYIEHFAQHFTQTGVIRIPKDTDDAEKFGIYEQHNNSRYRWVESAELESIGVRDSDDSFWFDEAGVCDAPAMCRAILDRVEFMQMEVDTLCYGDSYVEILSQEHTMRASSVVLATGYQNSLEDMRYMGIRGTWGSRGDYYSTLGLDVSMHQSISVSANIDGIIKLGATHNKAKDPCMVCDGQPLRGLFETASSMVDTTDFVLKETFCGMRSGSHDYFPLVGKVVDVPHMLESYPAITRGAKPPIQHIPNLYICNGLGGRGFVFAPMMAELLADSILNNTTIDSRINPDRLFLKWCRKSKDIYS